VVGFDQEVLDSRNLEQIGCYLKKHNQIREVILTGGDPLYTDNKTIKKIITAVSKLPDIEVIRIHTRAPIVNPARIDDSLLRIYAIPLAMFVVIHSNHPAEFTPLVEVKLKKIITAGIPVLTQTVLLKGINDSLEVLVKLMRIFVKNRIKPYYLHNCDLAKGNSHFRVDIKKGQELMAALRCNYSGLCQPTYILDIPGGFGKVPVWPHLPGSRRSGGLSQIPKNQHSFPRI
jgi:lysine 2,3-aminomutase